MRLPALVVVVAGCAPAPYYTPRVELADQSWHRVGSGAYAFVTARASVAPAIGAGSPPQPAMATRNGSTLAELTVAAGDAIEFPVELASELRGAGCQLDSVVIAHGENAHGENDTHATDLAIDIRRRPSDPPTPIVSYDELDPFAVDSGSTRVVAREAEPTMWSSDGRDVPGVTGRAVVPPQWPTGSGLRIVDRVLTVDLRGELLRWSITDKTSSTVTVGEVVSVLSGSTSKHYRIAPPLELALLRHDLRIAAPDQFSIVLRARTKPFAIAVRSVVETGGVPIVYYPRDGQPMSPDLSPEFAVIVDRCRRPWPTIVRELGH